MIPDPLYLLGQTGSGKHEVAHLLAKRFGSEIVSIDSVKVYRGMDIGSAKPTAAARAEVPYHLVDVVDPWEVYSAGRFARDAEVVEREVATRGKAALFVGGTALYYKAYRYGIFEGVPADAALRARLAERAQREGVEALHAELSRRDPAAAARIHPRDFKRIQRALEVCEKAPEGIRARQTHFDAPPSRPGRLFLLRRDRADLLRRVAVRYDRMIEKGWLDEVKRLVDDPRGMSREPARSHGYLELASHLRGGMSMEEARRSTLKRIGEFTRRQMQWFRSFRDATWVDAAEGDSAESLADRIEGQLDSPSSA